MAVSGEFGWATILLYLASGLIGALIGAWSSIWYHNRSEIKQAKLKILQQMMGNSFNLSREEFVLAINQVFIVFYDSKEVILALKAFYEDCNGHVRNTDSSNQKLLELFKAMFEDLNIETEPLTDNFFLKPFTNA